MLHPPRGPSKYSIQCTGQGTSRRGEIQLALTTRMVSNATQALVFEAFKTERRAPKVCLILISSQYD